MKKKNSIFVIVALIALGLGIFLLLRDNKSMSYSEQSIFGGPPKILTAFQKKIVSHFEGGEVTALAVYFEEEVALRILGDVDDFYLKNEAAQVLTTFYQNHQPEHFFVKHHGSSHAGKYYLIGELSTVQEEKFRIFVANSNEKIETIEITMPPENF